tara:strand:+ start:7503 stop:8474 length:972 start_codon:yes stop_codon:yes gene_type:complete
METFIYTLYVSINYIVGVKMKRKIIQIANSTQLVSLPKKWCTKYGIMKGEEIEVRENGNSIVIHSDKGTLVDQIKVNVGDLTPRLVDRFLARSYQKGYDKIVLGYKTEEQLVAIREKVKELLGFEILEVSNNECSIQSISSKLDINFDTILRKAFIVILDMADTCLKAYRGKDSEVLKNLYHKDFDANKFCYYCLRAINKEMSGVFGTYILYYLVETLEDVGDSYKALATLLAEEEPNEVVFDLLKNVNDVFRLGYEFFYNPQTKTTMDAMRIFTETKEKIEASFDTLSGKELRLVSKVDTILKLVYHYPTMRLDTLKELKGE